MTRPRILPRPHIPLDVRCVVAWRQCAATGIDTLAVVNKPLKRRLRHLLIMLFAGRPHELHHRPALENRVLKWNGAKVVGYVPDANDPDHLVYLLKGDHLIETHVRGVGALRSDTATRNHQKALDRNRGLIPRRPAAKIRSRGFQKPPNGYKHRWR